MPDENTESILNELKFNIGREKIPYMPWKDVPIEFLAEEMLKRNGRFQTLLSFSRAMPMAAAILDSSGRILSINNLAEQYWKLRVWDVRGKCLNEVLNLNQSETERLKKERERILTGKVVEIFSEHFHQGAQRISMICIPYPDDVGDMLMLSLILPHAGFPGIQPGY